MYVNGIIRGSLEMCKLWKLMSSGNIERKVPVNNVWLGFSFKE